MTVPDPAVEVAPEPAERHTIVWVANEPTSEPQTKQAKAPTAEQAIRERERQTRERWANERLQRTRVDVHHHHHAPSSQPGRPADEDIIDAEVVEDRVVPGVSKPGIAPTALPPASPGETFAHLRDKEVRRRGQ